MRALAVAFAVILVAYGGVIFSNTVFGIKIQEAEKRFEEMSGEEVVIVRHSYTNPLTSNGYRITFELSIKGAKVGGVCTKDGAFGNMVCYILGEVTPSSNAAKVFAKTTNPDGRGRSRLEIQVSCFSLTPQYDFSLIHAGEVCLEAKQKPRDGRVHFETCVQETDKRNCTILEIKSREWKKNVKGSWVLRIAHHPHDIRTVSQTISLPYDQGEKWVGMGPWKAQEGGVTIEGYRTKVTFTPSFDKDFRLNPKPLWAENSFPLRAQLNLVGNCGRIEQELTPSDWGRQVPTKWWGKSSTVFWKLEVPGYNQLEGTLLGPGCK